MVRSSCGRFSCIRFIRSRNLVSVRVVVAICWRKLAMWDYSPRTARGLFRKSGKEIQGPASIIAAGGGARPHAASGPRGREREKRSGVFKHGGVFFLGE